MFSYMYFWIQSVFTNTYFFFIFLCISFLSGRNYVFVFFTFNQTDCGVLNTFTSKTNLLQHTLICSCFLKYILSMAKVKVVKMLYLTKMFTLTHWGRDKMAAILQMTFSNSFSCKKNVCILIQMSLKFVPKSLINNNTTLFKIMVWRLSGDKPLSGPKIAKFIDAYMHHSASMS